MRASIQWTTEQERSLIVDEAVGLLERMGMRFGPGKALDTLALAGAEVDKREGVARIPRQLIERALASMPHEFVLGAATKEMDCTLDGRIHFSNSGQTSRMVDFETGAYRATTLEDLRKATLILERVSSVDVVYGPIVFATDCIPEQRILTEISTLLQTTTKHLQVQIEDSWQVEPIRRMAEVVCGDLRERINRPPISLVCATASPLRAHGLELDACIEMAGYGFPLNIISMPTAGGSAPVTVAGSVVMNIAEFLGAATAVELACPGVPLMMGSSPGLLDMRTTTFVFAAPEAAQMSAACVEVAHHLGVPALAGALATDAKHAGIQAGYEKALKGLVGASCGADLMSGGIGLLNGAGFLSLPQIVIDDEIARMIKRILDPVEISPTTIMADMIERAGFTSDYLREKETRVRIRDGEHFMPSIASRVSYEKWHDVGLTEYDMACQKVREILAAASDADPLLSLDQRQELDSIASARWAPSST